MKFLKYINEEKPEVYQRGTDAYNEMIQSLKRDCKRTLEIIEAPNNLLYRGVNWKSSHKDKVFFKANVRKDRKPLSTHPTFHHIIDGLFNKIWGWKARSQGLFVSCDKTDAYYYGGRERAFYCFPCGDNWTYVWSPIIGDAIELSPHTYDIEKKRLFGKIWARYEGDSENPEDYTKANKLWETNIEKVIKDCYTDKNIFTYFKKKETELMVNCDSYYMLKVDLSNIYQILEDCKK